ncbi:YkuD domain-containing protein [Azospirillaceae bacterium]
MMKRGSRRAPFFCAAKHGDICVDILVFPNGLLSWPGGQMQCALGRGGVRREKKEGDGVTPCGVLPMRRLFYRPDRMPPPVTELPTTALSPDDGWCDAPSDIRYNQYVRLPYAASHENLWREDSLYDLIVVLGWNDFPVIPGQGSAIFFHLAHKDYAATAGCVALCKEDMLNLLPGCSERSRIIVHSSSTDERLMKPNSD